MKRNRSQTVFMPPKTITTRMSQTIRITQAEQQVITLFPLFQI